MSEGSCLRYSKQGYIVRDCLLLPAQNPNRQPQIQRRITREEPQSKTPVRKPQVAATITPKSKTVTVTDIEEIEE